MLAVYLPLLLAAVAEAAGRRPEGSCPPSCLQLLARLPEVRRWCSPFPSFPFPEKAQACGPPAGFHDAPPPPPPSAAYYVVLATTRGYEALRSRDTRWIMCHASRVNRSNLNEAYFGAVWDASTDPCEQGYEVWLATYNAAPCWHHNGFKYEEEKTFNQETAMSLPQSVTYRCRNCSFGSDTVPDFSGKSYTYVITNYQIPSVFLYLSCNETGGEPYPTLKAVNSVHFTCEGCRQWINLAQNNSLEYVDCNINPEVVSTQASVEPVGEFQRKCKEDWDPETLPSKKKTTTSLNRQETSTEANIKVPERVQEALKQLDPQNFKDDPLKNTSNIPDSDKMLKNLDAVINFSNNLEKKKVFRSLEGFEVYIKKVLLSAADSKEKPEMLKHEHSTLVVAAGIIGAAVSDDGKEVDLLRYGQEEYSEEALLELSASAGVMLPVKGNESATAIAVTVLRHELLNASFTQKGLHLNSDVISVQVETSNSSQPTDYVDIFLKPRVHGVRRRCGIWDFAYNAWNFGYCTLYRRGQVIDLCRCWHLTHFAQLVTDDDLKWGSHAKPLEVLTLAGVFASLLGGIGLGAAAVLDRDWRRKPGTRVLLQLGSAVAARDFLLVLVTLDAFRPSWLWRLQGPDACPALGVALHYALLAAAAWTTAAAVLQLLRLSTIAGVQAVVPHVVLVCSVCSWLLPLVPVVVMVATLGLKDGYPLREDSATDFLCYPKGIYLYATVVFPVALCTAINAAIFLYLLLTVLFPICLRGTVMEIRRHGSVNLRRRVLTAVVLFFLLGLPWLLGPPARVPVLAYIFCAVATTQGMMLFVFFVVCNGRLRKSICASMSRVVFFTSTSSTGAGYSHSPHNTANMRVNDSTSDSAQARNRRKIQRQEELELTKSEGGL